MELLQMLQDLLAKIQELQNKIVDAQNALDIEVKAAYQKGFADGVASVQEQPSDKIYSQEDMDNAIKLSVEPLNARIAELEASMADIDAKIAEAVAAKIAEFKAKLDEVEAQF